MSGYVYETHMHTSLVSACARSSGAEQARAYKKRGYAGIIVTDHFFSGHIRHSGAGSWKKKVAFFASGYDDARREGEKIGLDVFFGWEYSIYGQDFLTYGLGADFLLENPMLESTLGIAEYSRIVRGAGGYLAQAHPFREGAWIFSPTAVDPGHIDGVEVLNSSMPDYSNHRALRFASEHGLPMQAGSDSHEADMPYGASGVRLPEKAVTICDIVGAIKSGQAEIVMP